MSYMMLHYRVSAKILFIFSFVIATYLNNVQQNVRAETFSMPKSIKRNPLQILFVNLGG